VTKIPIFQDSIILDQLNNKELDKKILEILKKEMQSNSGVTISNEGGYQTNSVYDKTICDTIFKKAVDLLLKNYNFKTANFELGNLWINHNKKEDFNSIHTHPCSHFSGVYYLQVQNDGGQLVFYRGDTSVHMAGINAFLDNADTRGNYYVQPLSNQIIIFPAHLLHMVHPHKNNKARVSVSFNILLTHLQNDNKN
tara:strand:+ start:865 stop:1452 length:588 start_codon:yes stop_codon:yes gene_type:complete